MRWLAMTLALAVAAPALARKPVNPRPTLAAVWREARNLCDETQDRRVGVYQVAGPSQDGPHDLAGVDEITTRYLPEPADETERVSGPYLLVTCDPRTRESKNQQLWRHLVRPGGARVLRKALSWEQRWGTVPREQLRALFVPKH